MYMIECDYAESQSTELAYTFPQLSAFRREQMSKTLIETLSEGCFDHLFSINCLAVHLLTKGSFLFIKAKKSKMGNSEKRWQECISQ